MAVHIDPIEKKPVYHLYPGSWAYSLSTVGCNLRCAFCQNWEISQAMPEHATGEPLQPRDIVRNALATGCRSIAYTYAEPTVFYEYVYDTAVLAKSVGLRNVLVSAGYINPEPLRELLPVFDIIKIDLKGFNEHFYRRVVKGELRFVLRTLTELKKGGMLCEVVNLMVPNAPSLSSYDPHHRDGAGRVLGWRQLPECAVMTSPAPQPVSAAPAVIDRAALQRLLEALRRQGYRVIGPRLRDGAIIADEMTCVDELPEGWTAEQDAGTYRLSRRRDHALFGYAVGPSAWKAFLFPPTRTFLQATRTPHGWSLRTPVGEVPRYAFLGVRSCDLHAIAVQDAVFLGGTYRDADYAARRAIAFLIAVNCATPSRSCFCASMGTGPTAAGGFDLVLTELVEPGRHAFLIEAGSPRGEALLHDVPHRPATDEERAAARGQAEEARRAMGRTMDTAGLKDLLAQAHDHPRWDETASRCLSCANCTMVCPTCFCTSVEDRTDLAGQSAVRARRWDSCFSARFSYVHGGSIRASVASRYRQWLTHKLSTWIDQFGRSGCVGCGRCITWCPAAIDLTEEVRALRAPASPSRAPNAGEGAS